MKKTLLLALLAVTPLDMALANGGSKAAKSAVSQDQASVLESTFKKFKEAGAFSLDVKKISKLLVGPEKVYDGKIMVKDSRFIWTNETPTKSKMVYDGEVLWNEQAPPPGIEAPLQVSKQKVDKLGADQPVFSLLRRKESLASQFSFEEVDLKEGSTYKFFKLVPKTGDQGVRILVATIDPVNKNLRGLRYEDELGNKTFLMFSKVQMNPTLKDSLFKYSPPRGAQITEL